MEQLLNEQQHSNITLADIMCLFAKNRTRIDKVYLDFDEYYKNRIKEMEQRIVYLMERVKRPHICPICDGGIKKKLNDKQTGYAACDTCQGKGIVWNE